MSVSLGVYGAGSIGAFLGVLAASEGHAVRLLGRRSRLEPAEELRAVLLDGLSVVGRPTPELVDRVEELGECDVILLCTKSGDTSQAARTLASAGFDGPVVSLQNGLDNPGRIRKEGLQAAAGMVSFNVFQDGSRFVQATSGPLTVDANAGEVVHEVIESLGRAGIEVEEHPDMDAVLAGKLLLNLNNGISALAGVPLAQLVATRNLRRAFAACIAEALRVYDTCGLEPAQVGKLPPRLLVHLLRMPNAIVKVAAKPLISIDPRAKSSTLQDLERGKPTEVDDLNGAIVGRAKAAGMEAPVNQWVVDSLHALEDQSPPKFLSADQIWAAIEPLTQR